MFGLNHGQEHRRGWSGLQSAVAEHQRTQHKFSGENVTSKFSSRLSLAVRWKLHVVDRQLHHRGHLCRARYFDVKTLCGLSRHNRHVVPVSQRFGKSAAECVEVDVADSSEWSAATN